MYVQTAAKIVCQREASAVPRPCTQAPYPFRHQGIKNAAANNLQQVYIGALAILVAQHVHKYALGPAAIQRPGDKQYFFALLCHNVQRYEILHNAAKKQNSPAILRFTLSVPEIG